MTSPSRPIERLLVANRGEIACRIIRSVRAAGIETVAVCSDPDARALHTTLADEVVAIGGDTPATSYLSADKLLAAAQASHADAIHPGYGFLAENPTFASAVEQANLVFVGPTAESIEVMGDKIRAREVAVEAGLPVIPSAPLSGNAEADARAAEDLGFPVLVKAAAGGGGRGMRVVTTPTALAEAARSARREAGSAFGDDRVYLEKYLLDPRHIEIQVFGDASGRVFHLGERECSVQRRHQKIIEEAPSPIVDEALRDQMGQAAIRLAATMSYRGAGTVEFVVDTDRRFYFLEMNTRLQVEHPVTELVTGTDLVRWQLDVARGRPLPDTPLPFSGHAIECRVYAEDPANGFLPTGGTVLRVDHPTGPGIRVDTSLYDGVEVPVIYDPLLMKVIAWAPTRTEALRRLDRALAETSIVGVTTNVAFLRDVLADAAFTEGAFTTTTVDKCYDAWQVPPDSTMTLTATIAAALLANRGAGTGGAIGSGDHSSQAPGPWETLGPWRVGVGRRR